MITLLYNLLFRKLLGPLDGVKTKLGTVLVVIAGVAHSLLTVIPSLATGHVYQTVVAIALKVGSVLAGLGLIDKATKIADALEGR